MEPPIPLAPAPSSSSRPTAPRATGIGHDDEIGSHSSTSSCPRRTHRNPKPRPRRQHEGRRHVPEGKAPASAT